MSSLHWFRRCRFQAFRFTCRVGQKLQVAGFLFQLYSGSQTRGYRPSVSLLQWARDSRFQTYRFGQVQFYSGLGSTRSEAPPFHLYSSSSFSSAACQMMRDKKACSFRCCFLISVAKQICS